MFFETTYDKDNKSLLCQLGLYEQYHPIVITACEKYNIPWSIIAGLGSRESQWGLDLDPPGPEGTGDNGHGKGLLQIDDRSHDFAKWESWKNPRENIFYGCKVLADSISIIKRRCTSESRTVVVSGYDPEQLVRYGLAAYNAGPLAVLTAIRRGVDIDLVTTGDNYSADVLSRAGWFQRALLVGSSTTHG